jgi:hypothetical protein
VIVLKVELLKVAEASAAEVEKTGMDQPQIDAAVNDLHGVPCA